jgi:hypothetical protein
MSQFERVIGYSQCLFARCPVLLFAFGCIQWLNMTCGRGLFCGPHLGLIDKAISWRVAARALTRLFFLCNAKLELSGK